MGGSSRIVMDRLKAKKKTPQAVAAPVPVVDPRKQKALQFQANRGVTTNYAAQQKTASTTSPSASQITGVKLASGPSGQKSFNVNFSSGKTGSSAAKADTVTDGAGNTRYVLRFADGSPVQNISKEQYDTFWSTGQLPQTASVNANPPVAKVAGTTGTVASDTPTTPGAPTATPETAAEFPAEIPVPSDDELEAQFFSSSRNKQLEEQERLQEKRNALEADLLAFEQDQQLQQNREIASRNAQTAQALTGGVGNFGGGNIGLSAAIQANGIKALDDEVRANRLEVRDLIQRQDEIAFNLDAQQQAELDNYVSTKKSEIAAANQEAYTRYKDQRDYNFNVMKEQNTNLQWLADYDLKTEAAKREEAAFNSKQYQDSIKNVQELFGFGADFFGNNPTTDAWISNQLAEYGIKADSSTFTDDMAAFEKQLDLLGKFTDLPPSILPMLKGMKNAELGLADTATLSALADAIKQDNYQKILDTAKAKAIAEGSAFGVGAVGGPGDITGGGFNPNVSGMRTDRHNNPVAMTTDVARTLGLIEGVDYVKGDPFPDNPNLYTARFLGDPIQTSIKALDTAASDPNKSAFYTQKGQQRWTYIGMSDQEWLSKTPEQKSQVIASMYQKEGGNGSLIGGRPQNNAAIFSPRDPVDQTAINVILGLDNPSNYPNESNRNLLINRVNNIKNSGQGIQVPESIKALDIQNAKKGTANPDSALRAQLGGYDAEYQKALTESKPKTDAQFKAAGYASRMQQSNEIITAQEKALQDLGFVKWAAYQKAPNLLKSELIQKQEQAERNFVNAVLRQESGAVIAPSEFESAQKQYFPQPGDTAAVIEQKRKNRELAIRNMSSEAQNAAQDQEGKILSPIQIAKYQEIINNGGTRKQLEDALKLEGYDLSQINQFTFR